MAYFKFCRLIQLTCIKVADTQPYVFFLISVKKPTAITKLEGTKVIWSNSRIKYSIPSLFDRAGYITWWS